MLDENNLVEESPAGDLRSSAQPIESVSPAELAIASEAPSQQTPIDEEAIVERAAQRLRGDLLQELDGRLGNRVEDALSRLKQSSRDSIEAQSRKQYQEMSDYIDHTFERMVAQGRLTAEDAEEQKALEKSRLRDQVDQQALQAAEQSARRQPQLTEADVRRKWDKTWQTVADEYELQPSDPEWKDFSGMRVQGTDWDEWVSSLRKGARQVSRKKEKRLAQEMLAAAKAREDAQELDTQRWRQAQSRAVPVDTGGGQKPVEPADPAQELVNLMKKGPPDDPKALARYLRTLKTLNARVRG